MARDEAERILGAWMGNGVGTVERFTAAFGLKNVLSSRFCICLGLLRLVLFVHILLDRLLNHGVWQGFFLRLYLRECLARSLGISACWCPYILSSNQICMIVEIRLNISFRLYLAFFIILNSDQCEQRNSTKSLLPCNYGIYWWLHRVASKGCSNSLLAQ